ncbi:hypothetical protein [Providencia sp. PROV024]|uniref:hypothetical protein n=1 Tax=Providencia sp. PROV024 TaxID=2949758 RepID=UPI002934A525|nr:hypothetical protein [Providencia sp. PROV024]WOC04890.1 hypothetical protein P3L56_03625 [Providencia sp. PROV024]
MKNKTQYSCNYGSHRTGKCVGGRLYIDNHSDYYDYSDDVMPCPRCNSDEWLKKYRSEYINNGVNLGKKGWRLNTMIKHISCIPDEIRAKPGAVKKIYRWLKRGYYYGLKNRH